MKALKLFKKLAFIVLGTISIYLIAALLLTILTFGKKSDVSAENEVFMNSSGVHLDLIIPIEKVSSTLIKDLKLNPDVKFLAFGCGEKTFFLNTPNWSDLTIGTAANAMLVNSETLIHVVEYKGKRTDWISVRLDKNQLDSMCVYISNSFQLSNNGNKILLEGEGYGKNDNFYEANYNYNCFTTCNTWVNSGLKKAELKACAWTPFAWGIRNIYKD